MKIDRVISDTSADKKEEKLKTKTKFRKISLNGIALEKEHLNRSFYQNKLERKTETMWIEVA